MTQTTATFTAASRMQVHFIMLNNEPQKCQLTYVCVELKSLSLLQKKQTKKILLLFLVFCKLIEWFLTTS